MATSPPPVPANTANRWQQLRLLLAASLLAGATIGLFGCINVFSHNESELQVSLPTILLWTVPISGLLSLSLLAVGVPLLFLQPERVLCFYAALCLLLCVQGNLLVHDYGPFAGQPVDWERHAIWGHAETILWIGMLAMAVWFSKRLISHVGTVLIGVMASQLLYAGAASVSTEGVWSERQRKPVASELFQFSKDENLIIILLDQFQSTIFSRLLAAEPELRDWFPGFTLYPNTLGVTPSTYLSVPALLSGVSYQNDQPLKEYIAQALGEQSLPRVLQQSGMQVNLLTNDAYCRVVGVPCNTAHSLDSEGGKADSVAASQVLDLVIFRFVPHSLKKLVFADYNWLLKPLFFPKFQGEPDVWRAVHFPEQLRELATNDAPKPTAKFFHLRLPHPPFNRDENCNHYRSVIGSGALLRWGNSSLHGVLMQSRCALKVTRQLLESFRVLDVYDNSHIIILADHGDGRRTNHSYTKIFPRMETAFPLFMAKPAGQRGKLKADPSALSLTDLPKMVTSLLKLKAEFPGFHPYAQPIPEDRPRHFLHFSWRSKMSEASQLDEAQYYEVRGPMLDMGSWRLLPGIKGPASPTSQ